MSGCSPSETGYLLLLGADMGLRERAVAAALRVYPGPIATMTRTRPPRGTRFFDHVLAGDCLDAGSALAGVLEFERATGLAPDAVVPFVDPSLMSGYAISHHYGLPYLSLDSVRHSSVNKDLMKRRLAEAGIPTPRAVPFCDLDSLRLAVRETGLPCVLKPSGFGGSMGVILVPSAGQLAESHAYATRVFEENRYRFSIKNPGLQAEPYCDLPYEVSAEVINHGGHRKVLAVTDKSLSPPPFFAEIGHRVPSLYSGDPKLAELAMNACEALGLDRGMAHVEIKLDGAGAMQVIEVGARTGGDGILDLVERVFGIAPYELHIRSYLDQFHWPQLRSPAGVAAIAFLKAPPGVIRRVLPPRFPAGSPVTRYEISASPGDVSGLAECYEQREGYVECFWPAMPAGAVPGTAHLELAADIARQVFEVDERLPAGSG